MDLPSSPGTPHAAGGDSSPTPPTPDSPAPTSPTAPPIAVSPAAPSTRVPPAVRWALVVAAGAGLGVLALVIGTGPGTLRLPGLPSSGTGTHWALPVSQLVGRIAAVATLGWLLTAAVLLPAARSAPGGPAATGGTAGRDGTGRTNGTGGTNGAGRTNGTDGTSSADGTSQSESAGAGISRAAARRLLTATARSRGRRAADAAVVWLLATLAELVFTLSDVSARPAGDVLDRKALRSFVTSTSQGRSLLVVAVLALLVAIVGRTVTTTTAAGALLILAGAALLPPVLAGHASSSGQHAVAIVALAVHVIAASLWVGGLLGLLGAVRLPAATFGPALRRYGRFAAGAAAATAVSGIGSAALRLGGVAPLWNTRYGVLVLLKAVGLVAAVALGGLLRRRVIDHLAAAPSPSDASAVSPLGTFVRLASVELTVLVATLGLAVGLARTAPPVDDAYLPDDPTRVLLGYPMPPRVTAARLALDWHIDWVFLAGCVFGAGVYLAGVRRLRARGDRWPVGRTVAWFVGLFVVLVATCSGLGRYGPVLLSVHMTQHMLLNMAAPIPLVLGAPVTLALRAMRPARAPHRGGPREWLVAGLHSWPVRFLTHPVVVTINFVGGLYVLYLTSLLTTLMHNHLGHLYMNVHFLVVGLLFFELIIGIDPMPRRLPHPARILMLIAVVPFHTFLGLTIMGSNSLLGGDWYERLVRPWGQSPLSDQHTAGGIAWSFGEIPTFTVLLVLAAQWARADDRGNRARERRIAAAGDVDAELDAYNAYLARLSARPGGGQPPPTGRPTPVPVVRAPRPREAADDRDPPGR
ncbi:putative membrane protein [Frankia sp. AiPs1]|uniref:cytochrome c oxidase assembly protein n=1 Tax=Frankia sp. AiPa1 TaxID=573492 RepID=UPI00202B9C96|nr:cytochrome c oxidase assembly protein [Frankia sp. AiPa1]MCL9761465.1 bifunctional copper resistance protein CopD/cytochrome c oxidase assembly protein [Frankia sp. AiPa1]